MNIKKLLVQSCIGCLYLGFRSSSNLCEERLGMAKTGSSCFQLVPEHLLQLSPSAALGHLWGSVLGRGLPVPVRSQGASEIALWAPRSKQKGKAKKKEKKEKEMLLMLEQRFPCGSPPQWCWWQFLEGTVACGEDTLKQGKVWGGRRSREELLWTGHILACGGWEWGEGGSSILILFLTIKVCFNWQ